MIPSPPCASYQALIQARLAMLAQESTPVWCSYTVKGLHEPMFCGLAAFVVSLQLRSNEINPNLAAVLHQCGAVAL